MHANVPLESIENSEDADNAHLRAQGHQAALERRFSPLAALGLGFRYVSAIIVCRLVQRVEFQLQAADTREAYSITNSWVGYLSNLGQNLRYDGPRSVVFGLLVATIVQWIITLGLSEVASAFPSAGVGIPVSHTKESCLVQKGSLKTAVGTISFHLHRCADSSQAVRCLRRGLDDVARLVGHHLLWRIALRGLRVWHDSFLASIV